MPGVDGAEQVVERAMVIDAALLHEVWPVARLVRRLVPGDGWQDVAQDALLEAWRRRDAFDPHRGQAKPWVLAIAVSHVRRALRGRGGTSAIGGASPAVTPDHGTPSSVRLDVLRAVDRLPPRQRLAVTLRYFLDLSEAETAAVMGCRTGTVKSTLTAARASLHAQLGEPS